MKVVESIAQISGFAVVLVLTVGLIVLVIAIAHEKHHDPLYYISEGPTWKVTKTTRKPEAK